MRGFQAGIPSRCQVSPRFQVLPWEPSKIGTATSYIRFPETKEIAWRP